MSLLVVREDEQEEELTEYRYTKTELGRKSDCVVTQDTEHGADNG